MSGSFDDISITDLVDNTPSGSAWDEWLAAHPDVAAEIEIARRVRVFMAELQNLPIVVPPDFEPRLMERIRADRTIIDLLDLGLSGFARVILELLAALFSLLPTSQDAIA